MVRRIFISGLFAVGVFLFCGRLLTWFVEVEIPLGRKADRISFIDLRSSIEGLIEVEGVRPKEERINLAIERGYRAREQGEAVLDEGDPDDLLRQSARRVSEDASFRLWDSPPMYVERNDLPNGFGFYLKGEDGMSNSGGNDEDDANSWGYQREPYYENRARRWFFLKYAAMAMVPTLLAFAILFRILGREEIEKRVWKVVKPLVLFVGIPGGLLVAFAVFSSFVLFGFPWSDSGNRHPSWKSDLPATATEVHELCRGEIFIGEYWNLMRAKVTKEEFLEFCTKLEMTPHSESRKYPDTRSEISWDGYHPGCGGWWVPTDSLDGTYVWQKGHTWTYAKYEEGYLYFRSSRL